MPKRAAPQPKPVLRPDGHRVHIFNSGLEVWLYDDGEREALRAAGGIESYAKLITAGRLVGYSLQQDDELDIELHVGKAFTPKELASGRWLEPQTALLKLPTGALAIESNDACRIGPEDPTDKGAILTVPPGDYRVTLLRIDHEALDREGIEWKGPQEVVLLTRGGTTKDATTDLLPFAPTRDLSWVGKYTITGRKAEGLAWFDDYWDTCIVNLDRTALDQLDLAPGTYFRITVPAAGLSMVMVFATNWGEGRNLPLPDGVDIGEFGYGSLSPMSDWGGAEALFCRRDRTVTRAEDKIQKLWLPATVEVLDLVPRKAVPVTQGLQPGNLRERTYFDDGFLALILSDVVPGTDDDSFPLLEAVERLDAMFGELGFELIGDLTWPQPRRGDTYERTARLYWGHADCLAAIIASEGVFEILFLSEREGDAWLVTGLADELERHVRNARKTKISVNCLDEELSAMLEAHTEAVAEGEFLTAPRSSTEGLEAFVRFLTAAYRE